METVDVLSDLFEQWSGYPGDWDSQATAATITAVFALIVALANLVITVRRLSHETSLTRQTEILITKILSRTSARFVSIKLIGHHIGGYTEDEIRQHLVRAGALRFADPNRMEVWVLLNRLSRQEKADLQAVKVPPCDDPPSYKLFPPRENAVVEDENTAQV